MNLPPMTTTNNASNEPTISKENAVVDIATLLDEPAKVHGIAAQLCGLGWRYLL